MKQPNSLLGKDKMSFLLDQLGSVVDVEGDVIEAGVYLGGSLYMIAQYLKDWSHKKIFGYDTFEGLPESESVHLTEGRFRSNFETVQQSFIDSGLTNVELVKGYFPDTCKNTLVSFAHLDMDLYKPTIRSLVHLNTVMNVKGIIVLDDYKFEQTPGIEKAVNMFLSDSNSFKIKAFDKNQIVLQKVK